MLLMERFIKASFLSLLIIVSGSLPGIAKAQKPLLSRQFLKCQTTLEHFRSRLGKKTKGETNQPYYENLYKQTEGFLNTIKEVPINAVQLDKCENLLTALQEIVGKQGTEGAELAPVPFSPKQRGGSLSAPVLETTPRRPLRKKGVQRKHIEYVDYDPASRLKKEGDEELEEMDRFHVSSTPNLRLSQRRRTGEARVLNEFE